MTTEETAVLPVNVRLKGRLARLERIREAAADVMADYAPDCDCEGGRCDKLCPVGRLRDALKGAMDS